MKKLKLFGLACLTSFAINTTAMAEQKVMKIASWIPPHYQNTIIFPKWAEMVEKATEGRVTVKLEYGLGHPASLFDLVEDGIADATWSFLSYMPGRFEAYKFAELPLTNSSVDAGATSELLYNVVDKNFKTDGEVLGFEGLYLAGLWTHPTNVIFLRKPIDSLADLKNQKIGAQGTLMMTADAIGAISTQLGGADAYEKLQQGIADGSFFPHEVYKSLRLEEVAPYVVELDVGLGVFAFVINRDFMASLSKQDRKAIENLSGTAFSKLTGQIWQQQTDAVKQTIKPEHLINKASIKADFKNAVKDIAPNWIKQQDANVQKAYADFHNNVK